MSPKTPKAMKGAKPISKGALIKTIAEKQELKPKTVTKLLNVIAETGAKEVKNLGKFKFPGLFMIKTRGKPATKAGTKLVFGEMKKVKAKPAKTIVKAYALAVHRKSI